MARVALDDLFRRHGAAVTLVGSFFAKWDEQLAAAVERAWNRWAAAGAGKPHLHVASNAWDMLRHGTRPLRR
eukprot:7228094-Lingulodinium_polyedra.AAC.1